MRRIAGIALSLLLLAASTWACLTEEGRRIALASVSSDAAATAAVIGDSSVTVRRMYEGPGPDSWGTSASPDGRYVTQTDWSTGDLAVLDLLTGEMRRVTGKKDDGWVESYAYAEMTRFSPDAQRIAYSWFTEPGLYQIRVIDTDGTNTRVLWTAGPDPHRAEPGEDPQPDWPDVHGWTPDGRYILATLYHDPMTEAYMMLIDAEDGSMRRIHAFQPRHGPTLAAVSPDGRFVAFEDDLSVESQGDENLDIYATPISGGSPVQLVGGPSTDEVIGWLPDGSLLFYSDRGLTEGVWRVVVRDGRPAGDPELMRGDLWGMNSIGLSNDALYYVLRTERPELYVSGLDLTDGRLVSTPTPVPASGPGEVRGFDWSPDGGQLGVVRWDGRAAFVLHSITGAGTREIRLRDVRKPNFLSWTADGQGVVLWAKGRDTGERAAFRLDLRTGRSALLMGRTFPNYESVPEAWSRDAGTAYLTRSTPSRETVELVARDVATGEDEVLRSWLEYADGHNPVGNYSLSRAGDRLAYFHDDRSAGTAYLRILDLETREERDVWSASLDDVGGRCGDSPAWSPDDASVLFAFGRRDDPDASCAFVSVPVDGGETRIIARLPADIRQSIRVHPDGNRIAFLRGQERGEIWRMDGLPGLRVAGR